MHGAVLHTIDLGDGKTLVLEAGRLAKQATGSVVARMGDTMVLCTIVIDKKVRPGQEFFPLTVDYREKYSAAGRFPGGFLKRENRPTDAEILASRLIDRCIRPLFPEGFRNEIQAQANVVSADPEVHADMVAGVGMSAALFLTGAPFDGPTGHVRVGRIDGAFVLNPTQSERHLSDIDLVVAGKEDAIVMVEGDMNEISEADMVAALEFGQAALARIADGLRAFRAKFEAEKGAIEPMAWTDLAPKAAVTDLVYGKVAAKIEAHLRAPYDKKTFYGGINQFETELLDEMLPVDAEGNRAALSAEGYDAQDLKDAFSLAEARCMREMILGEGRRLDGRTTTEVRPIWCEVGYLPRVHGSAIFTRGETQSLVQVTLGTARDVQGVDQVFDQKDKSFYLHYNFPSFSTGEVKPNRGPGRREIGHGFLAERALSKALPSQADFPYTVRVISDILESNGSSSMASVCGGTLAMMDAGVPMAKPVAGIAMGLIKEGDRVAVLSDILGTEDHLGDMDFKVCGTPDGITACQMDIKIGGLSMDTMRQALLQAREGRLHILGVMAETIAEPREDLAPSAPRLYTLVIDSDFIGAVIGPGGKVIKGIQAETGTDIMIEEKEGKGFVTIAARDFDGASRAIEIVKGIVSVPEVGAEYSGTVRNLLPFGAIIEILPGKEAMLHVSEMAHGYVEKPEDYLQVGDKVQVQLIEVRDDGKLRVSRKPFLPAPSAEEVEAARAARNAARANGGGERREGGDRRDGGRRDGGRRDGGRRR